MTIDRIESEAAHASESNEPRTWMGAAATNTRTVGGRLSTRTTRASISSVRSSSASIATSPMRTTYRTARISGGGTSSINVGLMIATDDGDVRVKIHGPRVE